jgi:hypothetical protein
MTDVRPASSEIDFPFSMTIVLVVTYESCPHFLASWRSYESGLSALYEVHVKLVPGAPGMAGFMLHQKVGFVNYFFRC